MTTTRLLMIFVPLVVIYSALLLMYYRPLTRTEGVRWLHSTTPIDTTTAEERSRSEGSFVIREERRFGITRTCFLLLATFGYIALCVGFGIALIFISRSADS